VKLKVDSRLASVTKVRQQVRSFLTENSILSPDSIVLGDILLAVTEALSNAVRHSVRPEEIFTVTAQVKEPTTFEFRLASIQNIDFRKLRKENDSALDILSSNGRGLFLIETLMDSVGYVPSATNPHTVELVMHRYIGTDSAPGGHHAI